LLTFSRHHQPRWVRVRLRSVRRGLGHGWSCGAAWSARRCAVRACPSASPSWWVRWVRGRPGGCPVWW